MKNIIISKKTQFILGVLAAIAVCHSANAQYIDDLSGVSGTGNIWSMNHSSTGQIRVAYSNTTWALSTAPTTAWAGTTSFDHGNSGTDDYIDFTWRNAVDSFDFTLWDWDGGGSVLSEITFSNGVNRVGVVGFGDAYLNDPGLNADTFSVSGNKMSYDGSLANLPNSDAGVGIRLRLANADGSKFNSFRMQVTSGYTFHGFGGSEPRGHDIPTGFGLGNGIVSDAVPEPSSAVLFLLSGLLLIGRRKRA